MPNTFAYIVLFGWPLVVFFLFRVMARAEALVWSIIGGYLLLPSGVGINPPVLPTFDKTFIPAASAAVMCLLAPKHRHFRRLSQPTAPDRSRTEIGADKPATSPYARRHASFQRRMTTSSTMSDTAEGARKKDWVLELLLVLLIVGPLITVIQNDAPVQIGTARTLPGLRPYDYFSMVLTNLVSVLPFLLGRRYLAGREEHLVLLSAFGIAGLLYSLPTLFEIRMSPQLSRWVYGFLDRPFAITMRDGGFRPVVFLHAGLWLAIFTAMVTLSTVVLWRHARADGRRSRWLLASLYMSVVMVLSHSLGALLILVILAPAALLGSVRQQLILACIVAVSFITYPALRGTGLIPVDTIYEFVKSSLSVARAQSFDFRLKNEDQLLARANQKPLAGWGGWGRGRVYDPRGHDLSVTDGIWVIVIGDSGWLGYIAIFGLLTAPILLLAVRRKRLALSLPTSGLCLVLAANLIDMVPNATLTPVTWLVAGALAGWLTLPASASDPAETPARHRHASSRLIKGRGDKTFRKPPINDQR